ncbi:MAG: glycoside hydrolase family 130 protein [Candidatus Dormibacteria bacterium]
MATGHSLFTRHPNNPLITAASLPYSANTVFNPAAVIVDGETILMMRVEDLRGISHLTVARSHDGYTDWRIDAVPAMSPSPHHHPEELWGLEDPRITRLPERDEYAVCYTAYSRWGPLVSMATTRDFRTFHRQGPIMPPEDKDAALFPRRFGDRWALIHRPRPTHAGAHIWMSFSPDLRHWGDLTLLLESREGAWWDAEKIGLGPPPLETPEGWLLMYHGVHRTASGSLYRVGLALLDLEDPRILLRRTDEWVFGPTEPYERIGDVVGVVFPCGWVVDEPSGELRIYYGAADSTVAVATARLADVMTYLLDQAPPDRRRFAMYP